jgi:predicted transcriptional regulator of viral defense system
MAIASSQSGYFTAAQALDAGYSYPAQRYHTLHQNWTRTDRGIYRLPEWPMGPHEDLVRWTLWSGSRAVVSHETALSVHGLGDVNPGRIHLTVPPAFRAKAEGVVLHRAVLKPSDIQGREGFSITTPLRSLVDVATGSLDVDQLATSVSEALDRGLVTPRVLREQADAVGDRAALRIERSLALVKS